MVTVAVADRMDFLLLIVERAGVEIYALERWEVSLIGWTLPVCHFSFWTKAWLLSFQVVIVAGFRFGMAIEVRRESRGGRGSGGIPHCTQAIPIGREQQSRP